MKHTLLRHTHYLLAGFMIVLLTSGCWFSSDRTNNEAQQDAITTETTVNATSPAPDNKPATIVFEEPPLAQAENAEAKSREVSTPAAPPAPDNRPRVAIIIDDMGYHRKIGDKLLALDLNLSFSFLPHAPFTSQQEETAYLSGRDVMVHLPMEASDPQWDPGPGALYLSTSQDELVTILTKNLLAVPHATGANNHMGSKFTENRPAMHTILAELKEQGLFFVDSFTTAESTGMDEAKTMGIKTNRRHVFLDNIQDPKKICGQLDKLAAVAGKQSLAIGIGHPYRATLDALRNCGDQLLETVQLVPVHMLVE